MTNLGAHRDKDVRTGLLVKVKPACGTVAVGGIEIKVWRDDACGPNGIVSVPDVGDDAVINGDFEEIGRVVVGPFCWAL